MGGKAKNFASVVNVRRPKLKKANKSKKALQARENPL